jgi:hypothetical protein
LRQRIPFSSRYESYPLSELSAYVELPWPRAKNDTARRAETSRHSNRLRHWAYAAIAEYRYGARDAWN